MPNYTKLKKKHDSEMIDLINKIRYYEYHDGNGGAFTACLLFGENGTILARGVSICSPQDGFNAKEGRNRSCGRALKALANMQNDLPIKVEARYEHESFTKIVKVGKQKVPVTRDKYSAVFLAAKHFAYKSEYLPNPTNHEIEIFE